MASNFPATSIDSFTTKVDGVDYPTAATINDLQNSVVAVQTKVGIDDSADTNSLDYRIRALYPIGTIYTNKTNSTNPATLFGFGTWVAIKGRVVVGLDAGQTEFDTAGETGGEKTHALTEAELATHTHIQNAHSHGGIPVKINNSDSFNSSPYAVISQTVNGTTSATTATNQNAGSGTAHNNLQPYVVCYVWERTA